MKKQDISDAQVNYVYLSIGSNLGNRIHFLEKSKYLLEAHKIKIIKILTPKGESDFAVKGQAVTLTLDKEVDISRGDLLCSIKNHNYFFLLRILAWSLCQSLFFFTFLLS